MILVMKIAFLEKEVVCLVEWAEMEKILFQKIQFGFFIEKDLEKGEN